MPDESPVARLKDRDDEAYHEVVALRRSRREQERAVEPSPFSIAPYYVPRRRLMFWLMLLALMILVPVLAGIHTWRALRREE